MDLSALSIRSYALRSARIPAVTRGRTVRKTVVLTLDVKFLDLVKRNFTATRPNQSWVATTMVNPMVAGYAYVAFMTDLCGCKMVYWKVCLRLTAESLSFHALNMASWFT